MTKGSARMRWFPHFLQILKALTYFVRNTNHVATLVDYLNANGMDGLSAMVVKMKIPNFAEWRWTTLASVCKAIRPCFDSLRTAFRIEPFSEMRDSILLVAQVFIVYGAQEKGTS